jgi:penicillin-binding protein 1A
VAVAGVALSGTVVLAGAGDDARLGLDLMVERVDLARLLATSGLGLPAGAEGLGAAALTARFVGRLSDPGSFSVTQRLDFTPPKRPVPAVERLKTDFVHEVALPDGTRQAIEVSPSSPDFIPLGEVPPLFVKALLLAEDAGFYGHRGLDLSELPMALATDLSRGSAARGASTLSQQLAKNLFLSREKSLGRKLQELALALLLESSLGKDRILEIYLNVIEWGPGLYGLRPAARHYFGKEPRELTAKETAFLVTLIPGPIKYQRSFSGGELSPAFEAMVTNLLAKLRSVGALSDAEYQAARDEQLVFPRGDPPAER